MKLTRVATLQMNMEMQDGAIFGNHLFRFGTRGECKVFDVTLLGTSNAPLLLSPIAEFSLSDTSPLIPHTNSASFGTQYFDASDEFPVLYLNIYNNYSHEENKHEGECLAFRILRTADGFIATLRQRICVGFVNDGDLWRSAPGYADVRPYGNFALDSEKHLFYAFTMRDLARVTRTFVFREPSIHEGEMDENGVKCLTLKREDIIKMFDTPYSNFFQGACARDGVIYSTEGFDEKIHPAIRLIDFENETQKEYLDIYESGFVYEPEFISFKDGICYYGDAHGLLCRVDFDE